MYILWGVRIGRRLEVGGSESWLSDIMFVAKSHPVLYLKHVLESASTSLEREAHLADNAIVGAHKLHVSD
jgi:hypothetical protein